MSQNLLLDTHVLLWASSQDPRLGSVTKQLLVNSAQVYISSVSLLEMYIKQHTGKLTLEGSPDDLIKSLGISVLDLNSDDCAHYKLFNPNNRDPFDNAIIGVASARKMRLLTGDAKILATKNLKLQLVDARL